MLKNYLIKLLNAKDKAVLVLIILGSASWVATMVKSGICFKLACLSGREFWGPNGHDGVWHIALAEAFIRGSWDMPVFAGEMVRNYHIGFDMLLAVLHKLTLIPTVSLYFQVLPIVLSLLIGYTLYTFVKKWTGSVSQAVWSLFFVYFGGSFGFLITLLKEGVFSGESIFWSQQAISTLVNPPFALSLILMFLGFWYLGQGVQTKENRFLITASVIFGVLVQIKVYAGILVLSGLFVGSLWEMLRRRGLAVFKVFITALIISILLLPNLNQNTKSLVYRPFWFIETMMQLTDRVGWQRFGEAMVNYKEAGNFIKFVPAYAIALAIFVIGNLGTRVIALPHLFSRVKNWRSLDFIEVIFLTMIVIGFTIPTFYLQQGTPWNTIQFVYYALTLTGIFAGLAIGKYFEQVRKKGSVLQQAFIRLSLLIFTLPTTLGTLFFVYLPARPPANLPKTELEALHFLAGQEHGTVLTYPFDKFKSKKAELNPPRPLYLYESTAYVSAFGKKSVFLEDEVNLDITGYDWKSRRKMVDIWYSQTDAVSARSFLTENNITYIYWVKGKTDEMSQRALLGDAQLGLSKIFENEGVVIYKTN